MPRTMHLVAYLKTGPTAVHPGGWRHPSTETWGCFQPAHYEHLARVLEAARFDGCFYADTLGIPDVYTDSIRPYIEHGGQLSYLDPMLVLPIMAQATRHLGLGCTLSTTFHQAYHLARQLASLDFLSGGRACWNIVTSSMDFEARNFGAAAMDAVQARYDQADEMVEACCALWDCWDEDALVMDKASGLFAHPEKVRRADYEGRYVRVRGPLTMPRSPQGRPVLMQAGSSPRGREFAARWAEVIFASMHGIPDARAFYQDIKGRMEAQGRDPRHCQICTALTVVVGETESIAREKAEYLDSLANPELELAGSSAMLGADLSKVSTVDELDQARGHQGHGGHVDRLRARLASEKVSFAEAARNRRRTIIGTGAQVADHMEAMFKAEACDGFVVMGNVSPGMYEDFAGMVVPELQRRGLFRTEYAATTLRGNLRS